MSNSLNRILHLVEIVKNGGIWYSTIFEINTNKGFYNGIEMENLLKTVISMLKNLQENYVLVKKLDIENQILILNDCLHIYVPKGIAPHHLKATQDRIRNHRGIVEYIYDRISVLRNYLKIKRD